MCDAAARVTRDGDPVAVADQAVSVVAQCNSVRRCEAVICIICEVKEGPIRIGTACQVAGRIVTKSQCSERSGERDRCRTVPVVISDGSAIRQRICAGGLASHVVVSTVPDVAVRIGQGGDLSE